MVLLLIGFGVLSWYVFTPEKLTPILRSQAEKFISCHTEIGSVELTLFSTFPRLGIKVDHVLLVNPMDRAPNDTLLSIEQLAGYIDIEALWKQKELILSDIVLANGTINAFIDEEGNSNLNVLSIETTHDPEKEAEFPLSFIDIGNVRLRNIQLSYVDESLGINTGINNLVAELRGILRPENAVTNVLISNARLYLEHNNEIYFKDAGIQLEIPLYADLINQQFSFSDAIVTLDGLMFRLDGNIELLPETNDFRFDVNYNTDQPMPLKTLMQFIPPSFGHYFEGIEADALISSNGNLSGFPENSNLPVLDMHIEIDIGSFSYAYFPLKLRNIRGNMHLHTDLVSDKNTRIRINRMSAKTSQSQFTTRGRLDNLFSDVKFRFATDARLKLEEFAELVPDTLPLSMRGDVSGRLNTEFTLSQLMQFEIESMKLQGNLTANDLFVIYDSLWVKSNKADIDFALPNPYAAYHEAPFIFAEIKSDKLESAEAGMFEVLLDNAQIMIEISDVRDTTKIPVILTSFKMDHLRAVMDTLMLTVEMPSGSASLFPVQGRPDHPEIVLAYNSGRLELLMGNESIVLENVHLDTEVINDQSQEDIFLQWLITGFLDIEDGMVTTTYLAHPVEIPAIKMDFDPERFDILDSRIILDKSDFKLSGQLNNMLSFSRGDTILQGAFNFVSNNTDILQLMTLTSGIGVDDIVIDDVGTPVPTETKETTGSDTEITEEPADHTAFTGPYMVPMGIDILLSTNIKQATFGQDTASNIRGDIRISDGILLLDELSFVTPAARMQLTAMYRTPRKNHLFLGMDYHMLDIEIERLLQMIPEIDTIMPMLRSFKGTGAFHMAIESYLDSTYTLKMSTLRGAASITGQDLVLMDGETFSEIARTLRFSRRAENRVDSLSAEFTIFRNEIDVYPFLIVMDRYSAVVGGRHNLDMSFNYHISVVESPLPVRLGIDVTGNMENLNYRLASPRYAEFYRPIRRGVVESRQLELRRMIREALLERLQE